MKWIDNGTSLDAPDPESEHEEGITGRGARNILMEMARECAHRYSASTKGELFIERTLSIIRDAFYYQAEEVSQAAFEERSQPIIDAIKQHAHDEEAKRTRAAIREEHALRFDWPESEVEEEFVEASLS